MLRPYISPRKIETASFTRTCIRMAKVEIEVVIRVAEEKSVRLSVGNWPRMKNARYRRSAFFPILPFLRLFHNVFYTVRQPLLCWILFFILIGCLLSAARSIVRRPGNLQISRLTGRACLLLRLGSLELQSRKFMNFVVILFSSLFVPKASFQ